MKNPRRKNVSTMANLNLPPPNKAYKIKQKTPKQLLIVLSLITYVNHINVDILLKSSNCWPISPYVYLLKKIALIQKNESVLLCIILPKPL